MKQAITYKDVKLSLGKIIALRQLEIRQSPGQHGELLLSVVLDNEEKEMAFYDMPDILTLTYDLEGKEYILFKGVVRHSRMKRLGEYMDVSLKACDMTYTLDVTRKIRSFQNISRTSRSVVEEVMESYPGCICICNLPNEKTGQIWFQYEETDWEFLRRFASHYGERLYADATYGQARFQSGLSPEQIETDWDKHPYRTTKDFKRYAFLSQNGFPDLQSGKFLGYQVESYRIYTLGSRLIYKGGVWFIDGIKRVLQNGLLVNTYELRQKEAMLTPKEYNQRISGISVDGNVVSVQRDKVRVSLQADTTPQQGAYWFSFSTVAATADGSGWYSMPEEGDGIRVYFPTRDEKEGYVITKHDAHIPASKGGDGNASGSSSSGGGSGGSSGGVGAAASGGAMAGLAAASVKEEEKNENPMDDPAKRNIFTQDGNVVQLVPEGVLLSAGASKAAICKNGKITFRGPAGVTVNAGKELYAVGANITLESAGLIRIDHEKGAEVKLRPADMQLKAKEIHEN